MRVRTLGAVLAVLVAAAPAMGEGADGRFQMVRSGDDVLRIDTATGAIDLCGERADGWGCRRVVAPPTAPAGDAQAALADVEAERDRLKAALGEIAAIASRAIGEEAAPPSMSAEARRSIDEALDVTDYTLRRALTIYRALLEPETGLGAQD